MTLSESEFPAAPNEKCLISHSKVKEKLFFVLRVLLFMASVTGFSYQAWETITDFCSYPTTVDIQMEIPTSFIAPAFTFCNHNRVKRSKYCEKYPDRCEKISDVQEFCKKNVDYCQQDLSNLTVVKYPYYQSVSVEDVEELGHDVQVFFDNFFNPIDIEGPFYFDKQNKAFEYFPCYCYNTHFSNGLEPRLKELEGHSELVSFQLDVEEAELLSPKVKPGAHVAIHHPFEPVNPFYGFEVEPGKTYHVYLQLEESRLLSNPYKTDCVDYIEMWFKNRRLGPRSKQMCIERCHTIFNMICYQCLWTSLVNTKSSSLCLEDPGQGNCNGKQKPGRDLEECLIQCKPECVKMKYNYRIEQSIPEIEEDVGIRERNLVTIKVFLIDPEVKVITHHPKYTTVELVAHIGGLLAIWIGVYQWILQAYLYRMNLKVSQRESQKSSI